MQSRVFEINDKELIINQNLDLGYAGSVWDSALVFAYFMINSKSRVVYNPENKVVLELGAGTGVLGLVNGVLGAKKIIMTDKDDNTIKILSQNYQNNINILPKNLECSINKLDWFNNEDIQNTNKNNNNIDYIIGSDLVWNNELGNALFKVIDYIMFNNNNSKIECFLSLELRDKEILKFFQLFDKSKYKIEKIPLQLYDDVYKDENILIIRIKKI